MCATADDRLTLHALRGAGHRRISLSRVGLLNPIARPGGHPLIAPVVRKSDGVQPGTDLQPSGIQGGNARVPRVAGNVTSNSQRQYFAGSLFLCGAPVVPRLPKDG
jgi:hypothetical protein